MFVEAAPLSFGFSMEKVEGSGEKVIKVVDTVSRVNYKIHGSDGTSTVIHICYFGISLWNIFGIHMFFRSLQSLHRSYVHSTCILHSF
jgi:hypothetical protein